MLARLIDASSLPSPTTRIIHGSVGGHLHQYKRNVRAAVMSARENAPSILPHLLVSADLQVPPGTIAWG